jgi:hypothetical protein
MKKLTILAALALSTQAMALDSVMGLKGRFDYVHTKTENTPGDKTSSGVLTTSFLRLVTDAKLNETTTAKLTLDFQPESKTDNNLNNLIDEAYLTKTLGAFSALVGKQAVMTGGRENDYSSRDLYLTSKFNDEVVENITGISVGYTLAGQNLFLQYLQQMDDHQTPFTDKKVIGAAYYGEFMNKMILPIISYHRQGTKRPGAYDNFGSAGIRILAGKILVEGDYLMLRQEKLTTAGDAKLDSWVAQLRYTHENFQPFAKFIKENGKKGYEGLVTGAEESERTAFEGGLEYYPSKDEDMRYHVVYNHSESKLKTPTPTSKVVEQKIYAGIAFNYNILK